MKTILAILLSLGSLASASDWVKSCKRHSPAPKTCKLDFCKRYQN
jgi:hypothetical protein